MSSVRLREALSTYEHALTLTPAKGSDRALLHANRAACFLKEHKVSDAIRECSSALEAEPNYERALVRRARAFEMAGKLDLACQDLTLACKARVGVLRQTRTQSVADPLDPPSTPSFLVPRTAAARRRCDASSASRL